MGTENEMKNFRDRYPGFADLFEKSLDQLDGIGMNLLAVLVEIGFRDVIIVLFEPKLALVRYKQSPPVIVESRVRHHRHCYHDVFYPPTDFPITETISRHFLSPPFPPRPNRRPVYFPGIHREIENSFPSPHLKGGTIVRPRGIQIRVVSPQPDPTTLPGRVADFRRVFAPRPPPNPPESPDGKTNWAHGCSLWAGARPVKSGPVCLRPEDESDKDEGDSIGLPEKDSVEAKQSSRR
ncbi:calcium/calmodulin-dependent protein kinase typeII subunit delta [Striga asiatica]|uniref:Calcium/calmodulin-dependent protein kinase typeII subunit delta n=1 Tax=Striga asiatica TaxID=4170 RepID=A0A5A7R0F2_STRAF|nr:calcium/calmodulin-dependent protein kinase typeII subunit delta [Striga asiatica]